MSKNNYAEKYLKYKNKYVELKQTGGKLAWTRGKYILFFDSKHITKDSKIKTMMDNMKGDTYKGPGINVNAKDFDDILGDNLWFWSISAANNLNKVQKNILTEENLFNTTCTGLKYDKYHLLHKTHNEIDMSSISSPLNDYINQDNTIAFMTKVITELKKNEQKNLESFANSINSLYKEKISCIVNKTSSQPSQWYALVIDVGIMTTLVDLVIKR